jgi:hypothetical protein
MYWFTACLEKEDSCYLPHVKPSGSMLYKIYDRRQLNFSTDTGQRFIVLFYLKVANDGFGAKFNSAMSKLIWLILYILFILNCSYQNVMSQFETLYNFQLNDIKKSIR